MKLTTTTEFNHMVYVSQADTMLAEQIPECTNTGKTFYVLDPSGVVIYYFRDQSKLNNVIVTNNLDSVVSALTQQQSCVAVGYFYDGVYPSQLTSTAPLQQLETLPGTTTKIAANDQEKVWYIIRPQVH